MSEARASAAFLQGGLAMAAMGGINGALAVVLVEQGSDSEGNFLPFFDVVCASGARIRVAVTPMGDDE